MLLNVMTLFEAALHVDAELIFEGLLSAEIVLVHTPFEIDK